MSRSAFLYALATLFIGVWPAVPTAGGDTEAAVRAHFTSFAEAWVKGDARGDRDEPPLHAKGVSVSVLAKRNGRWVTVVSRSYRLP